MSAQARPEVLVGWTAKVEAPEGTVFVTINEDQDKAIEMLIVVGKGGSTLAAWADALARVMSLALRSSLDISTVLQEISGITSSRSRRLATGVTMRSGPEAVAYAIMSYMRMKHEQNVKRYKLDDKVDNGGID